MRRRFHVIAAAAVVAAAVAAAYITAGSAHDARQGRGGHAAAAAARSRPARTGSGRVNGPPHSRATRRRPPTRAIRLTVKDKIPKDPRDPKYNPVLLARMGMDTKKIFASEPRDPKWAAPREAFLAGQLRKDLSDVLPQAKVKSVECHTLSCRVVTEGNKKDVNTLMFAFQWAGFAEHMTLDPEMHGGRASVNAILIFAPKRRTEGSYESWYRARREKALARWRNTTPPFPIPHK